MTTKTKKLAALLMSGIMTLSIAPVVHADDKVELTGMVQQSRWYSELQSMVEKLEEEENISIEFEVVPDDQYDNLMKMRLNSHEAPDLIAYQFADLFAAVDPEEFFVSLDDESWASKVKAPELTEYNGKHYGYCFEASNGFLGLIYNKDVFEANGITELPKTLDEFYAVCDKLKEAGITPITANDAYLTSFIGYHLARYIGQDGVKALVTGEEYNGESVTWDDEKVKAAAESFADFAKKGYFSKNIATNKYPAGQNQEFAPGDAAIVICGSWLPNEAKDSVADDLEWGYFNYPSVPDGKDDNTANNIANQVLAINKDSKMADKAFQLIEYITTGEYDKKMTEDALCIPTDKANSDAWPTELSGVKEAFDATTTFYDWAAGVESNNDITPVLQENTQKLASGKLDAAGFIKVMKEAAGQ